MSSTKTTFKRLKALFLSSTLEPDLRAALALLVDTIEQQQKRMDHIEKNMTLFRDSLAVAVKEMKKLNDLVRTG